jgi:serine/threonine-protein kinase
VTDLRSALNDALGPIYRVEREVRPVGQCRMFVVCEIPTGPDLLAKVLPATLSVSTDAPLLEHELLLLAKRLDHPNQVVSKGAGRAGPFVFHTRPFVAGTTLRAWLQRSGELPLARAVAVLRDVLHAVAHAHNAGVVHGDLKPENVLLAEGATLVADTGAVDAVGRAVRDAAPGAVRAALCDPAYIAPECKDGAPAGPRADVFALGVLAHEMLTGGPPAADALEDARTVPQWLGEMVRQCLAPERDRWADAGEALDSVPQ